MNDDQAQPEPPVSGFPLRGRRRLIIVLVTVVAAALIATGAVIAVVSDLSDRGVVDNGLGASLPPATSSPSAGPSPTPTEPSATSEPADAVPGAAADDAPETAAPWEPPPVADPVDLDEPADFTAGIRAEVTTIEAVEGEAQGPGEIGGPALRFTITLVNDSGEPVNLDTTVVALFYGPDEVPGVELSGPGADPFSGTLRAGETADAVYVFTSPPDQREDIRITVSYSPFDTTAAFEGSAA